MIGRSVLSQSKECIYKNFPGGFAPTPSQRAQSFEVSAEPDALFSQTIYNVRSSLNSELTTVNNVFHV